MAGHLSRLIGAVRLWRDNRTLRRQVAQLERRLADEAERNRAREQHLLDRVLQAASLSALPRPPAVRKVSDVAAKPAENLSPELQAVRDHYAQQARDEGKDPSLGLRWYEQFVNGAAYTE